MNSILITGSSGFVGQALCNRLEADGRKIRRAVRTTGTSLQTDEVWEVGNIRPTTDWSKPLDQVSVVIHLANRAHFMNEQNSNVLSLYRTVNVEGTQNLAQQASSLGVKRFIYISSVKVNGEVTTTYPYRETDKPQPEDAYGISKWEAEQALWQIAKTSGLEVTILRPPLVYGPGVKANFLHLMKIISRGIPLPFGAIHNKRSFLYVGNLVDAIVTSMNHPKAAGQTYLVSDNEIISTTALLKLLANAMKCPARLFPVHPNLLRLSAQLIGKAKTIKRLIDSLVVDSSKIQQELGWRPPYTLSYGLSETASWFLQSGQFPPPESAIIYRQN